MEEKETKSCTIVGMQTRLLRSVVLICLLLFSGIAQAAPEITFTVAFPKPWTHYAEIEMRVTGITGKVCDLVMPVWTPGSYLVREYARNVQEFAATDANDKPLLWRKTNKNTWHIEKPSSTVFTVRYRVYANVLAVQQAEITDDHAFWNNAAFLMHPAGGINTDITLAIKPPNDWKVATALDPVPGTANTFRAPNFDVLYDSPVQVGDFTELSFEALGKPHRIIITGRGNYDPAHVTSDVKRIVEAEGAMMGGLPYNNYTFLLSLRQSGGGLEHLASTALIYTPFGFANPGGYIDFDILVAHEYFHLWNVKRIKPDALGPFDYSNENYTRLLWVAEGLTSYYEGLFVRRAGLMSGGDFMADLSRSIAAVEQTPGRRVQSLEDASFDAWIKGYRPDENSLNSQMSYYTKGSVVGALLDLTIRQQTNGAKSLDDVMRTLYRDFAQKGLNYTPENFQRVCETVAGGSLEAFFRDYVRGTKDLDYDTPLRFVGLQLKRDTGGKEEAYLGGRFAADPLGLKVAVVPSDTPAYEQGLSAGDILLAVDGVRVPTVEFLNDRVREKKSGNKITLTLFRNDQLKTLDIRLGGRVRPEFRLMPVANPTATQREQFKAWTGAEWVSVFP